MCACVLSEETIRRKNDRHPIKNFPQILRFSTIMATINVSSSDSHLVIVSADARIYVLRSKEGPPAFELLTRFDLNTCALLGEQQSKQEEEQEEEQKERKKQQNQPPQRDHIILCSALAKGDTFFAVATATKLLILFELGKYLANADSRQDDQISLDPIVRQLPKTPSALHFAQNGTVLLCDRSGSLNEFVIKGAADAGNLSDGRELLGHLSMLLDFCITPCGRFILTADRDEKIRVSRFPDTFVIEAFCLGHTEFVRTVGCLGRSLAVSAGGDSVIRLWDLSSANCLFTSPKICEAPIRKFVPINTGKDVNMDQQNSDFSTISLLSDGANGIRLFGYNPETQTISPVRSINCSDQEERIADFCVCQANRTMFCVGRKGLYYYECGDERSADEVLRLCEVQGESRANFLEDLGKCEDKYPLDDLYKAVSFGNAEKYQNRKEQKQKRKRTSSSPSSCVQPPLSDTPIK